MTSKRDQSMANLDRFKAWLLDIEKTHQLDAFGRIYQGSYKLNRTKAAEICGFARSAFSTNPDFVKAVEDFETKCASKTSTPADDATTQSNTPMPSSSSLDAKDKEIATLRRRLHAKAVETEKLREELRQTRHLLDTVIPAGLPFPGKRAT